MNQKETTGIFYKGRNDINYVRTEELESTIEIPSHKKQNALHKDTVKVKYWKQERGTGYSGEVIEIVRRTHKGFTGTLTKQAGNFTIKPDNIREDLSIFIPPANTNNATEGQYVFVEIDSWKTVPVGKVTKILEHLSKNDRAMTAFALEKGFSGDFPEIVEQKAKELAKEPITETEIQKRKDCRNITTFTIDPDDAKDFDDALSVKFLDNNLYEIGIHIADVSHYVQNGDIIDLEAKERATSVYLVDRTIPMLPETLSNNLCSLRPNEEKLTYSAIFTLKEDGTVIDRWFGRTITLSNKRFTYKEAQDVLNNQSGPFLKELNILLKISKNLTQKRIDNGALVLEKDEVKFVLADDGTPLDIKIKERGDTNKLIEEFMLLANREVAKFMSDNEYSNFFVYRIHESPDYEKTEELMLYLRSIGYNVKIQNGVIPSSELSRILKDAKSPIEKDAISLAIAKSMQKAIYSSENQGHFGLAFEYYTHFTSPIRRYPDVMVHRLLTKCLNKEPLTQKEEITYKQMSLHSTEREMDATEAERNSIRFKQIEYIKNHLNEKASGLVVGTTEFGLFVRQEKTMIEGFVSLKNIPGDYFEYSHEKKAIVGKKSGKIYNIGTIVTVVTTKVNEEKQQIDMKIVK